MRHCRYVLPGLLAALCLLPAGTTFADEPVDRKATDEEVTAKNDETGKGESGKKERFARRWLYTHPGFDLRKDDQADSLIKLIHRAKKAGFTGVGVRASRLMIRGFSLPKNYYTNIERAVKAAKEADIELIPRVMSINGYSNALLSNNPNLAPGVPVRDCLFVVKDGKATVANKQNLLEFGDFEKYSQPHRPDGITFLDVPGEVSFQDTEVVHSGKSSLRFEHFETATNHGNCRILKKLKVKPWHEYRLSVWIKTEKVPRAHNIDIQIHGNVTQRPRVGIHKRDIQVAGTQDWKEHHAMFNSLHNSEVWVYIGGWNAGGGKVWLDDASVQEVAGINMVRREGCPVKVTSEDGSITYEEGRDFERWEYAQMGRVRWPGHYQVVHPEPPIVLTENSRIKEGQKLKVSFHHTLHHLNGGMCVCLSHDEVFDNLRIHFETVHKLYGAKTYMMNQDEIRLAGWCDLCQKHASSGEALAQCVRRCTDIIHKVDPDITVVTWSDMFDPNHNAVDNYWMTRGTMKGSWEGLDKRVVIGNWNQRFKKPSMQFFSKRGHHQVIATYYDRYNWQQVTRDWMKAAEDIPNVDGIMYTTWSNRYDDLEEFIRLARGEEPESSAR